MRQFTPSALGTIAFNTITDAGYVQGAIAVKGKPHDATTGANGYSVLIITI